MNSFTEQLRATDANLDRLARLATNHPDLFEGGHLIEVTPENSTVYIHAIQQPERDWKALANKYKHAHWQRENSPSCRGHYDWSGVIDGVKISILQAEKREQAEPLFDEMPPEQSAVNLETKGGAV